MSWRLTTIVSAATAGAERGGLDAAIELDLGYGGWRSAGSDIPAIYAARMRETSSAKEGMARRLNVQDSDGTLLVSFDRKLTGVAAFTERAASRRPYLHLVLPAASASQMPEAVADGVREWILEARIGVLHVSGPGEDNEPGIQEATRDVLVWIFEDAVDLAERSKPVAPAGTAAP